MKKAELRKEILHRRDAMSSEVRQEKSRQIAERVITHKSFQEADKVLLFASFRSEVDTTDIFQEALLWKKRVFFPKLCGKIMEFYEVQSDADLKVGNWGIREPEADEERRLTPNSEEKIFVLMPGVVFDESGGRIGYGGGYYDKFLRDLEVQLPKEHLNKVAIGFACQFVETGVIQKEIHDISPNCIITEEKVHEMHDFANVWEGVLNS